jgi:Homeodomain-like domain-containing protein
MPVSVRSRCERMFVRRKDEARKEAQRLRSELGWSLARIARELGVAKSSVSVWVRGVQTPRPPSPPPRPRDAIPTTHLRVWKSGKLRRCGRCGNHLPIECFNRLGDGLQWWCRSCFAAYFRDRGDLHRQQSHAAKQARQQALRAQVLDHLRDHPCVDCGEADPVVLEFDHLDEKTASISVLLSQTATRKAVEAEIARCEVVCTNCHRRRTAKRAGWRRALASAPAPRPYPTRTVERNLLHVYDVLQRGACADCGERDPLVLEFDHIGVKRDAVTRLAWYGCSLATLDAEIAQCEIRCANCHRRMTARRGDHFRFRVLSSAAPP